MSRTRASTLVCVWAAYVLAATLYPFEPADDLAASIREGASDFLRPHGARDFGLNVVLFLPLGAALYLRLLPGRALRATLVGVALLGAAFSASIELIQLLFPRNSSIWDVASNTLGAVAGALVTATLPRGALAALDWGPRLRRRAGTTLLLGLLLWGLVPPLFSIIQQRAPFLVWSSGFRLLLGNEGTLDRQWLGTLYRVALYDTALSEEETRRRFRQGHDPGTEPDVGAPAHPGPDALVLYTFRDGRDEVIRDVSGSEPPLDLVLSPDSRFRWLEPRGLEFRDPSIASSATAASGLTARLRSAHELTIELWMSPRDTLQSGPARIVSFSRDRDRRNFTLGQAGAEIEFRLRTPMTGRSGSRVTQRARWTSTGDSLVHVVATYRDGIQRLYVDAEERRPPLELTRAGIVAFGTPRTFLAGLAFALVYFFPVTFVLAGLRAARPRRPRRSDRPPYMAAALGVGLLVVSETAQVVLFGHVQDLQLILAGLVVVAAAAWSGATFGRAGGGGASGTAATGAVATHTLET